MDYEFPLIRHINDVLPAIEGFPEIIVAERDGFTVINYMVSTPQLWVRSGNADLANGGYEAWTIRRECRGIIFYPDGTIMSRPFHKFFNLGEKEETLPANVDFRKPHGLLSKMDGSMIRPLLVRGELRLGSKMGITDVSIAAEQLLSGEQREWLRMCVEQGITPLFEYVAPTNKIVINYDRPELIYLGQRLNFSGRYSNHGCPEGLFPQVEFHGSVEADKIDQFMEGARAQTGVEGYVIRFNTGHMVKVKNEWYVRIHKMLDVVRSDRAIVNLGLNEELDDAIALIPIEDHPRIEGVFNDFMAAIAKKTAVLEELKKTIFAEYMQDPAIFENPVIDKKRLALEFVPSLGDKRLGKFVFNLADGKNARELLIATAKGSLSTGVKFDEFVEWLNK